MTDKKPPASTAEILNAVRKTDGNDAIVAERQAARDRLEQGVKYAGPRYLGKTIEEWMDRADAGMASIHDIRKALYRATPKASDAVPALLRWLSHRHKHFRHAAARTLGLIGPEASAATSELARLLEDPDASVRAQALESLLNIGIPQSAVPQILRCLVDADTVVQRSALDCLAQVGGGTRDAIPQLVAALRNDQLVAHAAQALAAMGPDAAAAVPELARVLASHEFFEYRCGAAFALGRIGTGEAISALRQGINDGHRQVRSAVKAALKAAGR